MRKKITGKKPRQQWCLRVTWAFHELNMFVHLGERAYINRREATKAFKTYGMTTVQDGNLLLDLHEETTQTNHDERYISPATALKLLRRHIRPTQTIECVKYEALKQQL
jgi:hypothetical protein